jgi:hypothetical protein
MLVANTKVTLNIRKNFEISVVVKFSDPCINISYIFRWINCYIHALMFTFFEVSRKFFDCFLTPS